jgi:uncharacterized protein
MDDDSGFLKDWQANLAQALAEIGRWHMPFGKYGPQHYPPKGVPLYDLPDEYLIWFKHKGFPKGKLGRLLQVVCEIRLAGAEAVFEPLRRAAGGRRSLRPKKQTNFDFTGGELPLE